MTIQPPTNEEISSAIVSLEDRVNELENQLDRFKYNTKQDIGYATGIAEQADRTANEARDKAYAGSSF